MKWMLLVILLLAVPIVSADIVSPTQNSVQSAITASANFTELTNFEVFVDDSLAHTFTNVTQFNQTLSVSEGSHNIVISINGTNSTISNVTKDSIAPAISSITFAPTYVKAGSQVNITFTITEVNLASASVVLQDVNGNVQPPSSAVAGSNSVQVTIPSAAVGQTYINITATDTLGQTVSSKTAAAIIDNTAPTISIANPTSKIFASSSFKTNYTYTEQSPDKIIISLVGASQPGTISITANGTVTREDTISVASIADGIYALNITIIDKMGNSQSSIISNIIVVDNSKPNVTFSLSNTSVIRVGNTVTPTCTGSDNAQQWGGSYTVNISGTIDTSKSDFKSIFCTVTDSAGNKLTKEIQYDVLPSLNSTTSSSSNASVVTKVVETPISQSTASEDILHMVKPDSSNEVSSTESAEAGTAEETIESNSSDLPPEEPSSDKWPWMFTILGIVAVIGIGGWIWHRTREHPFTRGIRRNEPPELVLNIKKPNMEEYK